MGDFEYLSESKIDETNTVTFEFDDVRGKPRLVCAPAGIVNRPYWNALLREMSAQPKRRGKAGAKKKPKSVAEALDMSPAEQEALEAANRMRDARLFSEHCVRGWERAPILRVETPPGGGEPVVVRCGEFTAEGCRLFLESLAKHAPNVFDSFRYWIGSPASFATMTFEEVDDTAKNSERG